MTEILLSIFFISVLLLFLSTGVWVALSMIGVSTIAMTLFTSRPVGDAMATTICLSGWERFYLEQSYQRICLRDYHLGCKNFLVD